MAKCWRRARGRAGGRGRSIVGGATVLHTGAAGEGSPVVVAAAPVVPESTGRLPNDRTAHAHPSSPLQALALAARPTRGLLNLGGGEDGGLPTCRATATCLTPCRRAPCPARAAPH